MKTTTRFTQATTKAATARLLTESLQAGWTPDALQRKLAAGEITNPHLATLLGTPAAQQAASAQAPAKAPAKGTAKAAPKAAPKAKAGTTLAIRLTAANDASAHVDTSLTVTGQRTGPRGGRYVTVTLEDELATEISAAQLTRLTAGQRIALFLPTGDDGAARTFIATRRDAASA